eukprot:764234-Prymnesium_polylepis.1
MSRFASGSSRWLMSTIVRSWKGSAANLLGRGRLDLGHAPVGRPIGQLLVELPPLHPLVGHNLGDHILREDAVHLGVGQQQRDLLLAHDGPSHLPDTIDLLKVDRHREDDDGLRVVHLLGPSARHEVLDVEEDAHARVELAAALLMSLHTSCPSGQASVRKQEGVKRRAVSRNRMANVLPLACKTQRGQFCVPPPMVCWNIACWLMREEKVEARRRLEPRQVHKLLFSHGRQLHKAAQSDNSTK